MGSGPFPVSAAVSSGRDPLFTILMALVAGCSLEGHLEGPWSCLGAQRRWEAGAVLGSLGRAGVGGLNTARRRWRRLVSGGAQARVGTAEVLRIGLTVCV